MRKGIQHWLGVLLLAAGCPLAALDPSLAVTQYQISQWGTADGLPHGSVSALFEDRDGFLWVGTYRGAARFDGQRFLPLSALVAETLDPDLIETIGQTADGVLWFGGTHRPLLLLAPDGRVRRYGPEEGVPIGQITCIYTDPSGVRWLGTQRALMRVSGEWDQLSFEPALEQTVWSMMFWRNHLYAASERGVWRLEDGVWVAAFPDTAIANVHVWSLEPDGERLWIGYRGGLARYDGASLRLWGREEGLPHTVVRDLAADRDGNLWIGTSGAGIARLRAEDFESLDSRAGLAGNVTWEMVLGREGSLWAASANGLSRLKNASVRNFGLAEGLRSSMVWSVLADQQGGMFIGFNGDGVGHLDNKGRVSHLGVPQGPAGAGIALSLALDGGDLLASTFSGIYRYRSGAFSRIEAIPAERIFALRVNAPGELLFGMHGGLWQWRGQKLEQLATPFKDPVLRIVPEKDGSLLLAVGRAGVWRLRGSSLEQIASTDNMTVRDVFRASDGRLYVAALGLFVLENGALQPIDPVNRRMIGQLHAIAESPDRHLWVNSNLGVLRVGLDPLAGWLQNSAQPLSFQVIDEAQGMRSSEGNGGAQNSISMADNGMLWLATTAGVVAIDTRVPQRAPLPSLQVRFERVLEDGLPHFVEPGMRVAADVRRLQFEYTVAAPGSADALEFQYRLYPLDREWVSAGALRSIALDRQAPGDYRLEVRAGRGAEIGEPSLIAFTVEAFWWQRRWVQLAVAALIGALAALGFWARLLALARQRDLLESEVAARTAELAQANAQLAEAARRDFLTRLGNRRRFTERINTLWELEPQIAMALIDLDHFKAYNDRLGHLQGDDCLQRIGQLLLGSEGAGVEAFRVGGEEFAVIAWGEQAARLPMILRDLRERLADAAIPHPDNLASVWVTLSIGHAIRESDDARPEQLYARADARMYRAKRDGRNRIEG